MFELWLIIIVLKNLLSDFKRKQASADPDCKMSGIPYATCNFGSGVMNFAHTQAFWGRRLVPGVPYVTNQICCHGYTTDPIQTQMQGSVQKFNNNVVMVPHVITTYGGGDNVPNVPPLPASKSENEHELGGPVFAPALYLQRYYFTQEVLRKYSIKSVVDFGCSQCTIVRFLVGVPSLEKVQLVDIDRLTLDMNKFYIKPQPSDYLAKRDNPLEVQIFEGSATEADNRIMGCEAVTMVEFIEHLYMDDLNQVITNVFDVLRPKLVVITTPNYDFNQLFPGPPRFRHADHKFEWTQVEFQNWCVSVANTFNYSVEYSGVGDPPAGLEHHGFCSQAAIFVKIPTQETIQYEAPSCYKLVAESTFPHKDKDRLSPNSILNMEVQYAINFMKRGHIYRNRDGIAEVPVDKLLNFAEISKLCDKPKLREHLKNRGYSFSQDESCVIVQSDESDDSYGEDDSQGYENETSDAFNDTGNSVETAEFWD